MRRMRPPAATAGLRNQIDGPTRLSVAEVAPAGEDHRRAAASHRRDHLGVALRAAGLDDRASPPRRARAAGRRGTGRRRRRRATAPARSWPSSRAFSRAIRTASTRLIWPAPMPIVCRSLAITIAFEVTCLQTRHAKRRSPQSVLVDGRRRRPPSLRGPRCPRRGPGPAGRRGRAGSRARRRRRAGARSSEDPRASFLRSASSASSS